MKKKFFKRVAAFAVASLMAVGVITVLPEEYLPQIGTNVSAEKTYSTKIKIKRIEIVNNDITVTVNSITDTNNNFINDGKFTLNYSVNDYNNLLPDNPLGVIHTYGCNYDDDGNASEWGFSGNSNTTFTSSIISLYAAVHSYDEYCIDLGYADRNVDDYESTFVSCIKVYFDPKHTYIEDFTSDETGHWYACNGCDEKIDFAAHTEDNGTVIVEPTGTTEEQKVYKCTVCGYTTKTEYGVAINEVNFPDEIFRQYVSDNFDNDNDSFLSSSEVSNVKAINVSGTGSTDGGIQSLKGIEYFTALTSLDCHYNSNLTSLDVSKNTALKSLDCYYNQLTSLDVSNNTALTRLACSFNKLTSLDVSNNTALTDFHCGYNQLTSINVSNNIAITFLTCAGNKLTSLDVSKNTALKTLECSINPLTSLDVSNNTLLTSLLCETNQLTSLDVSNNTALTSLDIYNNQLKSLDTSNNTALESLTCNKNPLISLDLSKNIKLTRLNCRYNQLTSLDLSNNPLLTKFEYSYNSYNIGETCGTYDLKNLPTGFDWNKASNWQGATVKDDKLTEIDGTGIINYDYDCGYNHTATFSLIYDYAEHSYDDGVITIEPTEEAEGEKTYTCTNCGATKTEPIAKLEHVHNQGTELMSDSTGHWYTCSGCDEKLDFATHTEDSGTVTVEPTEVTEGQKVYKCSACGYTTRTETVEKLEHVHNQGNELMSNETGHWYACSGCDEKLDFATHTEDSGTVTVEPTETTNGQKVYKCTVCGYTTRTETVANLGHVHNQGATLMSDATGHWYTCSDCDEKLDFATHIEDTGTITVEPTENTEGQKVYKCTVCGYTTRTDIVAKLEHVHNKGTELVSDGTGHWYTCGSCDEKLDFATHTEDNGTVTLAPTVTTEGQNVYKCTVCDYTTRTETIAKLEHVHNKGTELVSDGTGHWYTCGSCDEKLDFATHTEDNGTITLAPTVTTEGQRVYKCTVCGYTTRTETIAKLENGNTNPSIPSQPTTPTTPTNPTNPTNPTTPQQPATNESDTIISAKNGWGNVVKQINAADENSKITVDMGNTTNVPKNVMNAIKGKNIDIVLDMGDGITWTINGKDVTDPQSIDFSVTKKKNSIPQNLISDPNNTIPLVLAHNGNFGCSATLSIELEGNDKKIANLYYYNSKTKELEFVDSDEIVNGKANLVFTHASDWAIVISDISAEYEDVSSAAGVYEADDNSQAPLCMIVIIIAAVGFSSIIIAKRFAKKKH